MAFASRPATPCSCMPGWPHDWRAIPPPTTAAEPVSVSTRCCGSTNEDVAVFGGDCVDLLPGPDPDLPLPLHQLGIGAMGLTLLDWPRLDDLLALCRRLQRHDFLLTVAPLPIVGGAGSPVNPIATF